LFWLAGAINFRKDYSPPLVYYLDPINAPASFQCCTMPIFSDTIEKIMEVLMDDFYVNGKNLDDCLKNIDKVLQRCEEKHLVLN
jgi:hypothetical protein